MVTTETRLLAEIARGQLLFLTVYYKELYRKWFVKVPCSDCSYLRERCMKCEERLCAGDDADYLTVCDADLRFEEMSCLKATLCILESSCDYWDSHVILILTLCRRRKPSCFFHCLVFICANSSIKYLPCDLLVLLWGWKRSHCRDAGLQSCRNILLQTCFCCAGGQ